MTQYMKLSSSRKIIRFKRRLYLPHQWEFLTSKKDETALVTGFGGGKTFIFLRKCLWSHINLKGSNGKSNGWVIYPTYALAEELFVEQFKYLLLCNGIKFKYQTQKHLFKTNYGKIRILPLMNPNLFVGSDLTWCGFDEYDLERKEKAMVAYTKTTGRMRGCEFPQIFFVTTPEGYRATHKIFVEDFDPKTKLLIQGSTRDNTFGQKGYVERLERTYTPQLANAYIEGRFTNLQSGSVYPYFDRDKCHTDEKYKIGEPVVIGQDFNYGGCCSSVFVPRNGGLYQVFEYTSRDTEEIAKNTLKYFPHRKVTFIPDASGEKSTTNASKSDLDILRSKSFRIEGYKKNPRVENRVNSVNRAFHQGIVKINTRLCPKSTNALEQHAFDQRTGAPEKFTKPASIDDWNDSIGYPIVKRYPISRPRMEPKKLIM